MNLNSLQNKQSNFKNEKKNKEKTLNNLNQGKQKWSLINKKYFSKIHKHDFNT